MHNVRLRGCTRTSLAGSCSVHPNNPAEVSSLNFGPLTFTIALQYISKMRFLISCLVGWISCITCFKTIHITDKYKLAKVLISRQYSAVQTEETYTNNVKVVKRVYSSVNMPAFRRVELTHVQFVLVN